jgi:hypothetical protein
LFSTNFFQTKAADADDTDDGLDGPDFDDAPDNAMDTSFSLSSLFSIKTDED